MARARDQFRQSDVTTWGVVALVCGGVALLSANLAVVVPDSVFAGLHASRLGGATVNEIHSEISNIVSEQSRSRSRATELASRADALDRDAGSLRQRLSALEESVPRLTEAINMQRQAGAAAIITGSIDAPPARFAPATPLPPPLSPAAASPSVAASGTGPSPSPILPTSTASTEPATLPTGDSQTGTLASVAPGWAAPETETAAADAAPADPSPAAPTAPTRPDVIAEGAIPPMPAPRPARLVQPPSLSVASTADAAAAPAGPQAASAGSDVRAIGVAIGGPVPPGDAFAAWQVLAAKVGVMLVGTSPLLADDPAGGGGKVLVAGPITDIPTAARLCGGVRQAGLACMPMPFVGGPVLPTP